MPTRTMAEWVSSPDRRTARKRSREVTPESETITQSSAMKPAIRSASLDTIARAHSSSIAMSSARTALSASGSLRWLSELARSRLTSSRIIVPSAVLAVLLHEGAEGVFELLGGRRGERCEEPALGVIARQGGMVQDLVAGRGQFDDVPAPVVGVRMTRDQTLVLQYVHERDHGRAVDPEPRGGLLLGCGLAAGQHEQHR